MNISSADIANMTASEAQHAAEDLAVKLTWAIERITALENLMKVEAPECPELPSARRSRLSYEYYKQIGRKFHAKWLGK